MTAFVRLTRNFSEREFFTLKSGGSPYIHEDPPEEIRRSKLPLVASLLQWLRDISGSPGLVVSYYRSPERNAAVAESGDKSQHITGEAGDAEFLMISSRELARRVLAAVADGTAPDFGQIIFYPDTKHVHVSLRGATHHNDVQIASPAAAAGPRTYATLTFERLKSLSSMPGAVLLLLVAIGVTLSLTFFFPATLFAV